MKETKSNFFELKKILKHRKSSPFLSFLIDTKGISFYNKKGDQLDKWEVFAYGHRTLNSAIESNNFTLK